MDQLVITFTWRHGAEGNIFGGPPELSKPTCVSRFRLILMRSDVRSPLRDGAMVLERCVTDTLGGDCWETWSDRGASLVARVLWIFATCEVDITPCADGVNRYTADLGEFNTPAPLGLV